MLVGNAATNATSSRTDTLSPATSNTAVKSPGPRTRESITKLKRIGLKGQYYRTPESMGIESVKPSQILTHRLDFVKAHYGVNDPQGHGGSDADTFDDREGDRTEPSPTTRPLPLSSEFERLQLHAGIRKNAQGTPRAARSPSRLKKDERLRVPSASNDRPTQRQII